MSRKRPVSACLPQLQAISGPHGLVDDRRLADLPRYVDRRQSGPRSRRTADQPPSP